MENVITTRELCAACQVTREAVRQWRDLGMPCKAVSTKVFIYSRAETLAWLDEHLPKRGELLRASEAA